MLRSVPRNVTCLRAIRPVSRIAKRFLSEEPREVFTRINDFSDPARNTFFQYSWGSWLKNDKIERARRETRFSIEGASRFVKDLTLSSDAAIQNPKEVGGSFVLPNNLTADILGEGSEIKSIASIHEGKHHRIYKLTLSSGKELALRIPYKLESDFALENKIKSEVATLDFMSVKLDANVPKVVAYGPTRANAFQTQYILMEHIEGELLMKQWNPLAGDSAEDESKLKSVIEPISEFQDKLLETTFSRSGSLYFKDDVSAADQAVSPYEETDEVLKNRWRVGPSVEKAYSKGKKHLSAQQIKAQSGPFDADKPLSVIEGIANVQLEALKGRLALAQANAGSKVENIDQLKKQITTFENFKTMSTKLFNPSSPSIKNSEELFAPRLFAPDLDPLNVIVEAKSGKPYFVDFEHTSIKPFIFANYPAFVAYQGSKIYDLENDIEGYKDMDDVEKQQFQFMYCKTRNEKLWEIALNEKRHSLIAVASPHIKVLKAPYLQALDVKGDRDYLFVENAVIQLQAMWDTYVANSLCNATDAEFPVEYTAEYLNQHQSELEEFQKEVVSTPFAATGGWVPQDMFDVLKEQGILVADAEGNYKVETEAALKDAPEGA